MERLAVVIDNSVLSYPGIDPFRRVADAYPQAASVVINPKTIVVQMLAGNRRDLNQATNQTTRRAPTAIAHAHALVLGAAGAALEIAQLHRAGMGVGETICGQRLQALGLEAGIEREQHEQRRQIARKRVMAAMQIIDERADRQSAPHAHEIEALQRRVVCNDKALPRDDRFDVGPRSGDDRVALIGAVVGTETAEHRFDVGPRGVAQRAGDEGAISIAWGRAARRCGQRVAQPLMQVGRDPIGPVCLDRAQCVDDLADRYVPVDRAHPALFERGGEPIDMDCTQVVDAGHPRRTITKPGEEVTIDLHILLDDAGRTNRSPERSRSTQRAGEGDSERTGIECGHIDQDRSAMPRLDGELEAEHRIGLLWLRRDRREGDRPALAGMAAHAPCGPGSSASSSSTAASTVSARVAIWSR